METKCKNFIAINRIISWVLVVLILITPNIANLIANINHINIVNESANIEFNSELNESKITLDLDYSDKSGSAIIEIEFFGDQNNSLGKFRSNGINENYETFVFDKIAGEVKSYKIVDYKINHDISIVYPICSGLLLIAILYTISAYHLIFKKFDIEGSIVEVYIGFIHNRVYVDNKLATEVNSFLLKNKNLEITLNGKKIQFEMASKNTITQKTLDN